MSGMAKLGHAITFWPGFPLVCVSEVRSGVGIRHRDTLSCGCQFHTGEMTLATPW